jgi:hypothetical protein
MGSAKESAGQVKVVRVPIVHRSPLARVVPVVNLARLR